MTKTQWYKLVEDWEKSGLSKAEFCAQIKLCRSQFYYWQKKRAQELTLKSTDIEAQPFDQLFTPIDLSKLPAKELNTSNKSAIEICLPHGIVLKIPTTSC